MTITKQIFPFSFVAGLNSKVDSFQLTNNELLQANNVIFDKDGAADKRNGTICLSKDVLGGGQITRGFALQPFNDEMLLFDGTFVYSYLQSQSAWVNRGIAISTINTQNKILSNRVSQQNNPDGTNLNGLECFVWEDVRPNSLNPNAGVRFSVIDSATGSFIVSDASVYPLGFSPKILGDHLNGLFHLYYQAADGVIFTNTIDTNLPFALSPFQEIIVDGEPTFHHMGYDVCMINDKPTIVYGSITGIQAFDGTNFSMIVPDITISCLATYQGILGDWWIVYGQRNFTSPDALYVHHVDTSTTVLIENISVTNIAIIEADPGTLNITYEVDGSPYHFIKNVTLNSNDQILFGQTQMQVGLASKPFKILDQIFINTIFQSTNQSTYFTLCVSQNMSCVGKINAGVGGTYRNNFLLAQCDNFANIDPDDLDITNKVENDNLTRNVMFANQKKGAFTANNGTSYSLLGVNASYIDFNDINAFNCVTAANNLHIVGGVEKIYDRVSIVEDNFHLYPETVDGYGALVTLTSGGNLSTGQYQYVTCYEWTDNNNQVQRGQPSIPITVQATAGQAAKLQIPTLPITDKVNPRSPVAIAVFRTTLQNGFPSSIFSKVTSDSTPLVNDINVSFINFTDTASDAQILGNAPLYTSQQLPNSAPPACSLISNYQTRVFLSGLEDPKVMWFSQDRFELDNYNTIPVEFSPFLFQGVDEVGGNITAVKVLDLNLIIFKQSTIFVMSGDGPNANATSGQFTNAVKQVSDTGCVNANSIVEIPANQFNSGGLMYQSQKGIYLFDRGGTNSYIGRKVEQYNFLTITSAEVLNQKNSVVFSSTQGICLCYNYLFDRWSTWSFLPSIDSCLWASTDGSPPRLAILQSDGTVRVQTEGLYTDLSPTGKITEDRPVTRTIQTPWLAFAGLQGFQCVLNAIILGHYISPHLLNISVCYNYNPAPREPVSINSNMVSNTWGSLPLWGSPPDWGGGLFTPYQFLYYIDYPWCQSLSLIINDVPHSDPDHPEINNTDQGVIFSAITFEVGVFDGAVRIPPANRFSGKKTSQ